MRDHAGHDGITPPPIHQHVGPAHVGREIDVFLVGCHVAIAVNAPPLVPCHDAGFDPSRVGHLAGCGEIGHNVRLDQGAGLPTHQQHPPRRLARRGGDHIGRQFGTQGDRPGGKDRIGHAKNRAALARCLVVDAGHGFEAHERAALRLERVFDPAGRMGAQTLRVNLAAKRDRLSFDS